MACHRIPPRAPRTLGAALLGFNLLALGCNAGGGGGIGSPCRVVEDCESGLLCDEHDGNGSCQDDHGHDTAASRRNAPEQTLEVDSANPPAVKVEALEDPISGLNLHLELTDFELAPEHASTDHQAGEGHMHLYVDGEKRARLYTEWYHLSGLSVGRHVLRVELNANSHEPLTLNKQIISDSVEVDVVETEPRDQDELEAIAVTLEPFPGVEIIVTPDPASGWNLHTMLSNFSVVPEKASTDPVPGEGHLHWFINGELQGRLYGDWYHIDELPVGSSDVTVGLATHDDRPLVVDGALLQVTQTIEVSIAVSR